MRFGVYVPNFGAYADPRRLVALAREAEDAGWDGFFLYDHIVGDARRWRPGDEIADPWIALAAIAATTRRIRFGPLVTALARRRPWKVARELTTLDHLSGGRVIFGVGLGGEAAFASFGEASDARVRAARLDEALEVVTRLWAGGPVRHEGPHFQVRDVEFLPRPVQSPRIPIWVAGVWPSRPPFRRAARWDGVFPLTRRSPLPTPQELRDIRAFVARYRTRDDAFEVVVGGATAPSDGGAARASAEAGATWWLEWLQPDRGPFEAMRARVLAGPPPVDGSV